MTDASERPTPLKQRQSPVEIHEQNLIKALSPFLDSTAGEHLAERNLVTYVHNFTKNILDLVKRRTETKEWGSPKWINVQQTTTTTAYSPDKLKYEGEALAENLVESGTLKREDSDAIGKICAEAVVTISGISPRDRDNWLEEQKN